MNFFARETDIRIRAPLFQRVLFPEIKARYLAGDAASTRVLAKLSQDLFQHRQGWEALGWPGEVDLWREAYRRDTTSELAREKLVGAIATFMSYTLHELPAGVLYGSNSASMEECNDLIDELTFFRKLLTPRESDRFRRLLELASVHYPNYREYLRLERKQGYSTFLAEQRPSLDASALGSQMRPIHDQTEEFRLRFRSEIEAVGSQLEKGIRASQLASALHAKGLSKLEFIFIFREATGAPIEDLKAFMQWWGDAGVTDAEQFDALAARVFRR